MRKIFFVSFLIFTLGGCAPNDKTCNTILYSKLQPEYESQDYLNFVVSKPLKDNKAELLHAAWGGHSNAYKSLKAMHLKGENIQNEIEEYGELLLFQAVVMEHREAIKFYIERGVDPLTPSPLVGSVMLLVADLNHTDMYEFLRQNIESNPKSKQIFYDFDKYFSCLN